MSSDGIIRQSSAGAGHAKENSPDNACGGLTKPRHDSGICSTFFDSVREGIFMLQEGRVVDCNNFAARLFNLGRNQVLGRTLQDLSPERQPNGRNSAELMENHLEKALNATDHVPEWQFSSQAGRDFFCELSFSAQKVEGNQYILVAARDIAKQKQTSDELAQKAAQLERQNQELVELRSVLLASRNKLKGVFDALDSPIFSLTRDMRIESLNAAAAGLTGLHPRELAGLGIQKYLQKAEASQELSMAITRSFEAMLAQGNLQYAQVGASGPAQPNYYEISVTPVCDEYGEIEMGIVHLMDVTTYKRTLKILQSRNRELEHKLNELSQ
jgi:PAS domain S-box-containing protein